LVKLLDRKLHLDERDRRGRGVGHLGDDLARLGRGDGLADALGLVQDVRRKDQAEQGVAHLELLPALGERVELQRDGLDVLVADDDVLVADGGVVHDRRGAGLLRPATGQCQARADHERQSLQVL